MLKWWERWYAHQRTREEYDDECLEAIAMRRSWHKYGVELHKLPMPLYVYVIGCLAHDLETRNRQDAWKLFDSNVLKFTEKNAE